MALGISTGRVSMYARQEPEQGFTVDGLGRRRFFTLMQAVEIRARHRRSQDPPQPPQPLSELGHREQIAAMFSQGMSIRAISRELVIPRLTVAAVLDSFGVKRPLPLAAAQEAKNQLSLELREQRKREAGPCGICPDPECEVSPGHCHHPGCKALAPIAVRTNVSKGLLAGEPMLYCEAHRGLGRSRQYAKHAAAAKQSDQLTLRALSKAMPRDVRRGPEAMRLHIHKGLLESTRGELGELLVSQAQLDAYVDLLRNYPDGRGRRFNRTLATLDFRIRFAEKRGGPVAEQAEQGRFNVELAKLKGKTVGRPMEIDERVIAQIRETASKATHLSNRAIAEIVSRSVGARVTHQTVGRVLARNL